MAAQTRKRFRAWVKKLQDQGLTRTAIAQRLDVSPSVVTKLADGAEPRSVSLKLAFAIEREAGIPASDWVDAA